MQVPIPGKIEDQSANLRLAAMRIKFWNLLNLLSLSYVTTIRPRHSWHLRELR
jgi:hypothetical protein